MKSRSGLVFIFLVFNPQASGGLDSREWWSWHEVLTAVADVGVPSCPRRHCSFTQLTRRNQTSLNGDRGPARVTNSSCPCVLLSVKPLFSSVYESLYFLPGNRQMTRYLGPPDLLSNGKGEKNGKVINKENGAEREQAVDLRGATVNLLARQRRR